MAITCPQCGAEFDVTLFQFDRRVRCDCGTWVELARGHVLLEPGDVPPPAGHDRSDVSTEENGE